MKAGMRIKALESKDGSRRGLPVTGRRCGLRAGVRESHINRDITDILSKVKGCN